MQHEPCSLLSNAKRTGDLAGTDSVLGIGDEPDSGKPLLKAQRRVLEDGSNLGRKLPLGVGALALPLFLSGEEGNVLPATGGANYNAIRPAVQGHVFKAVVLIREVNDGFLKSLWRFHGIYTKPINLICQLYNYPFSSLDNKSFAMKRLQTHSFRMKRLQTELHFCPDNPRRTNRLQPVPME
jgi:hypothetical protein